MGNKQHQARIEQARKELHSLALELGISHPKVLSQSVKLDMLINEYIECQTDEPGEIPRRDH
ncbi:hypothetical protein AMQ84_18100 [Paenibacillus riograndensis]|uniref:Sporulation protein Spo0E n=1 Tax=Paenibacillus riograndensis TaxID=483937 RepID=A0A132TV72_9BACL|nr:aspartyl-phosphate phosphatase Spo0E family protein [Paenibacillus riograndensis]KWX75182.1 hypothetical protein AMQ84_18100 [Paenibacillus riograndensis]